MPFDGETYEREHDGVRLGAQMLRVTNLMLDGQWRTLDEVQLSTGDPMQAISARLRDLRKSKFGGHTVHRRRRGEAKKGVFEYRLEVAVKQERVQTALL